MIELGSLVPGASGERVWETPLTGSALLDCPVLNKGSAFPEGERRELNLLGLLPPHVSTLEEQVARRYYEYQLKANDLERYIFLRALQDRNETLFYRLLQDHIAEMLPVVYTPAVGGASQHYSTLYNQPRGLFIPYLQQENLDAILANRYYREADVIVVTDGERTLGLGDQGIGGMAIPVGKLSLYTLCGGIHPARTLPIQLDAGTDNPERLEDPLYLGWRHPRVRGPEYDAFIETFVQAVMRQLPGVLLQWEDFALDNALRLLERYRDRLCTFNDDIQGTGAVALGALLAAAHRTGLPLRDHRLVILGAGSAGTGIARQIIAAMAQEGLREDEARARLWLVDRAGLLHTAIDDLRPFQMPYRRPADEVALWPRDPAGGIPLLEVVRQVRPTALIGTSGRAGAFTEEVVRTMAQQVERPIIFPLSNPTSHSEARPADLALWTDGRALVATGSPFGDVVYRGGTLPVSQCNNAYVFPGLGLGVIACGARRIPDALFLAAARALADCSPARLDPDGPLLLPVEKLWDVSGAIAVAVAAAAQRQGLAEPTSFEELTQRIETPRWQPRYWPMRRRMTAS